MTVYEALANLTSLANKGYGNMQLVYIDHACNDSNSLTIYDDIYVIEEDDNLTGELEDAPVGLIYIRVFLY